MASSVNGHDGKYQRAAHGQPRHSALTDGDGAAAYALPWSDDDLRAFDYTALDAETRIVVQQRTGEIKSLMRRTAQDIIEIGLKLTEVKARLGHGSFGGWLKAEFEWSQYTAINFMRVAEKFGNFPNLGDIAPSALYLLAAPSTPDAAREEALERAAAGAAVTFRDAKAITAKHKTTLERFPEPLRPAIIQIAEAQAGSLNVPLTPKLVERTGAVITEAATTGCVDTGDGQSTPLAAALTLEQVEALKRQSEYIRDNNYKRDNKANRAGNEYTPQGYDACQTPGYALDPLLPHLDQQWTVWEPACGENLLVDALYDAGWMENRVIGTDILTGHNFFEYVPETWNCLVTNPPYSLKYKWLERCYKLGKPFALLLPVETLGAQTAQELFRQHGIEVIFMDKRINFKMPNKGWEGAGAQFPTAWFTWNFCIGQQITFARIYETT